jgi:hypothetical protein
MGPYPSIRRIHRFSTPEQQNFSPQSEEHLTTKHTNGTKGKAERARLGKRELNHGAHRKHG